MSDPSKTQRRSSLRCRLGLHRHVKATNDEGGRYLVCDDGAGRSPSHLIPRVRASSSDADGPLPASRSAGSMSARASPWPSSSRATHEAPTVLLLHAWGESLAQLRPDGRRTASRGARAGGGPARSRADGQAAGGLRPRVRSRTTCVAFLDEVDVASAVLVGSSSGGYVAQQVAVLAPDRVDGLVLAGSPREPARADRPSRTRSTPWSIRSRRHGRATSSTGSPWRATSRPVPRRRVQDALAIPAEVWRLSLAGLTESTPPLRSGRITGAHAGDLGGSGRAHPRGRPAGAGRRRAGRATPCLRGLSGTSSCGSSRDGSPTTSPRSSDGLAAGSDPARIVVNIPAPLPCSGGARSRARDAGTTPRSP